jgi:glycosyltransferase involved in cell wall biosynthesis
MSEALLKLLRDETLRARLAQAGRERVEQHYSWEQVARKTYNLFRQILRGKATTDVTRQVEVAA